jgi:hypothetical protein
MSSSITLRAPAVAPLGGRGLLTLQSLVADVVAVELGADRQHRKQHRAQPVRVVDPGQRPGQQLQLDPGGLQAASQRHQFGGVARGPLELVHGEDDRLGGRGRLDIAA